ncbi:cysteinyl-tRNA synthetase [Candidatus Photodesmus blepharus]|uniref:Cysteine--tRNA ligase n=1 Tax=Candidatus Photodesmus blepharonis TaxID=1179155 RepID=A0A084CPM9_9GAMM|nr:cysteine--tRNA ligase [Candidatus Photodesmus blepharus]KEY91758.1 cysteinyl-tRNA synthetase [Candidatus Photodesmus blepharus]
MLKIYNTLTKKKEEFKPIFANKVGLYVCGVTIYDLCHIGHGRTFASFDVISRYLRYLGYKLTFVRNITDIDDKIIKRALENNESCSSLTERLIIEMHTDFDSLNIQRPDFEPRATDYIAEIIKLIKKLIEGGFAYIANNGDVVFEVRKYKQNQYGQLSKQNLDQLKISNRANIKAIKHSELDFVLWKMFKPGEPSWESPWGLGRPGWHIECSAMSSSILGHHFDIHGGGSDLKFPHHENEIAQSCSANSTDYVNVWMHSGMLIVKEEKMSKSLGNFFTIRDILKHYNPETVRYFLTYKNYRSQLKYDITKLNQAHASLERLYTSLRNLDLTVPPANNEEYKSRFITAMNDDFNTSEAYSVLFDIAREINRIKTNNIQKASELGSLMRELANIIGILYQEPETFFKGKDSNKNKIKQIEALIELRNNARISRDWKNADMARKKLNEMDIKVEDGPNGTTWRRCKQP